MLVNIPNTCMQDNFTRARTRPKGAGQARATIGYLVYNPNTHYFHTRLYNNFNIYIIKQYLIFKAYSHIFTSLDSESKLTICFNVQANSQNDQI